ncbi:glycosyltransferase family 4 protein [Salinibacter ruber]|uniref:glycosyltransferase family 4 protein n=1 Tax=Salinibacter ruber TaxID=146919 RepID=UPI0020733873|nr:glycosyltransferase family 4 protein [Salinibacter ruber]MCS4114597.1 glycosyltransferase involved in cell wall biosynthesis [Salinibacter ruber]MCS4181770.1 glycosyltransferase involved in cell wall biosynthesis [Salinibacter ruber]
MKVVHLTTWSTQGGAARAAYRLHQGLQREGVHSRVLAKIKDENDDTVIEWDRARSLPTKAAVFFREHWKRFRLRRYSETRPDGVDVFSQAWTAEGTAVAHALPDADVYHLHWINEFIDPKPFFKATDAPVVWTLHDMNPFTGGCHYNAQCRKFEEQCGACPQLGSDDTTDLSRTVWKRKLKAYQTAIQQDRLHVVSPSNWLAEEADSSALFGHASVDVIPHGLDIGTFCPRNTDGIRKALEIPKGHRIVLFVADYSTRRKGFDLLTSALKLEEAENVMLVSIGSDQPEMETEQPHLHLGRIESDTLLSVFYSLADLFVIPSRQEAFGQTALEAMACGTPVVGFEVGGIPDMVRPGETGWLAASESARALREAIEAALSDEAERERTGQRCREVVEEEYALGVQAKRYKYLYDRI